MGLGEQYTAIRDHLLMMTQVTTLSAAYRLLMQEKNKKKFGTNASVYDSVSL